MTLVVVAEPNNSAAHAADRGTGRHPQPGLRSALARLLTGMGPATTPKSPTAQSGHDGDWSPGDVGGLLAVHPAEAGPHRVVTPVSADPLPS